MPVTSSAKKALRVSRRKADTNTGIRRQYKEIIKKARKNPTEANVKKAFSALDKAAKTNVIHPNKAARLKSRLAKLSKKIPSQGKKAEKIPSKTKTKKVVTSKKSKKIVKSS